MALDQLVEETRHGRLPQLLPKGLTVERLEHREIVRAAHDGAPLPAAMPPACGLAPMASGWQPPVPSHHMRSFVPSPA